MLVNHSQTTSDYIPQTAVGSETQHFNFDFSLYFLLFLDNIRVNSLDNSLDKVLIFIFLIQIKKKKVIVDSLGDHQSHRPKRERVEWL